MREVGATIWSFPMHPPVSLPRRIDSSFCSERLVQVQVQVQHRRCIFACKEVRARLNRSASASASADNINPF